MRSEFKSRSILILLIAVSAFLHFVNLKVLSLSNDELSAITRAEYGSFGEMIRQGVYIDFHPAGVESFIYFWMKIFGDGALRLRFPFVLCGLASIWFIFEIGRKWFNEFSALVAVILFVSSSLVLQYTQIARMYSTGIFFCLMAVYGWTNFLFKSGEGGSSKDRKGLYWWIWVLGMVLAIHNHYFSFAFVGIVGLSGMFFVNKENRTKYILGGVVAALSFVPELPIFFEQMKTGDIGGWLGPPEKTFFWNFIKEVFNHSSVFLGLTALWIIAGFVIPTGYYHATRWRILSVSWFTFVFLLAYLYSVLGHPVIQFSTLLFGLPFLFLFISSFTPNIPDQYKNAVLICLMFICGSTLIASGFYSKNHFGVFKEISDDVSQFPKDAPVVVNVINPKYFDYYFSKQEDASRKIIYKVEGPGEYATLIKMVDTCRTSEFGFVWSNNFHPYEINEIIRSKYPYLIRKLTYFNAGSYLYSKNNNGALNDTILFSFERSYNENEGIAVSNKYFVSLPVAELIDSSTTFSKDLKVPLKSIGEIPKEMRYATLTANVYFEELPKEAAMVLSVDDSTQSYIYVSRKLSDYVTERGKWYSVLLTCELPRKFNDKDLLSAFFLNPAKEKYWIDDFKVTVRPTFDPYLK
jgi:hypothetical protein